MSKITAMKMVERENVVGTICDVCGKEAAEDEPKGWHHFSHSHQAWGNDSIDSVEYFDVCSPACYVQRLEASLKENGGRTGFQVNDMDADFTRALVAALRRDGAEARQGEGGAPSRSEEREP